MALCKRVVRFGANTLAQVTALSAQGGANSGGYFATKFRKLNSFSSLPSNRYLNCNLRPRHACVVDTLALEKALEAEGVPSKQAKVVTNAVAKLVNDALKKNVANSSSSKAEMQKDHYSSMLDIDLEKIRSDTRRSCSELCHEIHKCSQSIIAGLEAAEKKFIKFCTIRQQKDIFGRHCSQFLSNYIWVYSGYGPHKTGIKREIDEALRPGVYALVDACSAEDLQYLHTVFGEGPCRNKLASLQHDYKLNFQYGGKV